MEEKRCSKCKEKFPATIEYFYFDNARNAFRNICIGCHRKYMKESYKKNTEGKPRREIGRPRIANVVNEGIFKCRLCGNEYPYTSDYFCVNKGSASGLTTRCRACQNAYDREKYAKRKAEGREREYIPDPKYAELLVDRDKRDEEAYKKLVTEPKDRGIGDKLNTLKFQKDKKYKIHRRKNDKNEYEEYFTGVLIQETNDHITLKNKAGYPESFRKYCILCGDYKVKEI